MDHACHPVRYDHYVRCARRDRDRKIRQPQPRRAGHHVSGRLCGFASAWAYENTAANPNGFVSILIAMSCAILASMAGGLIYAFLTISLRANQNVTGLALTTFGMGVANFFGVFILNGASYSAAPIANKAFSAKLPVLSGLGALGQTVFSYGFLAYAAIALAVVLHWFLTRTARALTCAPWVKTPPRRMQRASMSRFTSIWLPASAQASAASAACTMCWTTIRHLGHHRPDRGAGLAGRGTRHLYDMEAPQCHLGRLPVRYALLAVPVPAQPARHHAGQLYDRPCADAALCRHHRGADRGFDAQEKENQPPAHLGLAYFREER